MLDCNGATLVGSGSSYGIYSSSDNGITIKNCNVQGYNYGIYVSSSIASTITNNVVKYNDYNGFYLRIQDGTVTNNQALNNGGSGFYIYYTDNNNVNGNIASNNKEYGFYFDTTDLNDITSNTVRNNTKYGIYVDTSNNNNVWKNDLYDTGIGYTNSKSNNYCVGGTPNNYYNGAIGPTCSCYPPANSMAVIESTTFCSGTYNLPNGIDINADSVVLDCNGATLVGSGSSYGIYSSSDDGITIKNCNVEDYNYGIYVSTSTGSTITNNIAKYNDYHGFYLKIQDSTVTNNQAFNNEDSGFYIYYMDNNDINGNTASNNRNYGFNFDTTDLNDLTLNTVRNNTKYGIYVDTSNNNNVWNNNIYDTGIGYTNSKSNNYCVVGRGNNFYNILNFNQIKTTPGCDDTIKYSKSVSINKSVYQLPTGLIIDSNNIRIDCDGSLFNGSGSGNGITMNGKSNVIIEGCRLENYDEGIYLSSSSNNILKRNAFVNNDVGLYLTSSSLNNQISYNNLFNNTNHDLYNGQSQSVVVKNNYWGTTNISVIDANIYDDEEGKGKVDFEPVFDHYIISDLKNISAIVNQIDTILFPVIKAYITVIGQKGQLITELKENNFNFFEDDTKILPISIRRVGDIIGSSLSIVLSLDYSGSMSSTDKKNAELAANTFIDNIQDTDSGAIAKFSDNVDVIQDFTNNKYLLHNAVNANYPRAGGNTELYDSIYIGVDLLKNRVGRKAVLVFSDGEDTASENSLNKTIIHAQTNNIAVFTVGIGTSVDNQVLKSIAYKTGGQYYWAPNSSDLKDIYYQVSQILNNQYVISYFAPNPTADSSKHNFTTQVYYQDFYGDSKLEFSYPLSIKLTPSAYFNLLTQELWIQAYAYDNLKGEKISQGRGLFTISHNGTTILRGELNYSYERWQKTLNLAPYNLSFGTYTVQINLNNVLGSVNFVKTAAHGNIFGYTVDATFNIIPNTNVKLYNSNDYLQGKPPLRTTISNISGAFYFGNVSPGYYKLEGTALGYEKEVSRSFEVSGVGYTYNQYLYFSPITTALSKLIPDMNNLYNQIINTMVYESTILSNETQRVEKDLGYDIEDAVWSVLGVIGDVLTAGAKSAAELSSHVAANEISKEVLQKSLKNSIINNLENNWIRYSLKPIAEDLLEIDSSLLNSLVARTVNEIISFKLYNKSIYYLNTLSNGFKNDTYTTNIHPNFDEDTAKNIIYSQIKQLNLVEQGKTVIILPSDPNYEPAGLTLKNTYNGYMGSAAMLQLLGSLSKALTAIQITAGSVAIYTAWTGGGAAVGATVAVAAGAVNSIVSFVETGAKIPTTLFYGYSILGWVNDVAFMPDVYKSTSNFIIREAKTPYYTDKNNKFDVSSSLNLKEDLNLFDRKLIFILPFTPASLKQAEVTVINKGNDSVIRVVGEGYWDYDVLNTPFYDIFGGVDKIALPTSVGYFKNYLSKGSQTTQSINYMGYYLDPINMFNPHYLSVNVFTGPFFSERHVEYYFPVKPTIILIPLGLSKEELAKKTFLKASFLESQQAKQLSLQGFSDFAPIITKLIDTNISANSSILELNYTVPSTVYSIGFQLFTPLYSDIDLHIYDKDNRHIGYDEVQGDTVIEFPATYNGRESNPEIISINGATNKTYKIRVKLAKSDSLEKNNVKLYTIEDPFRPAILGVSPNEIIEETATNQNVSFTVIFGESGKQHPLENVTVSITKLTNKNKTLELKNQTRRFQNIGLIPAENKRYITFTYTTPEGIALENYTGGVLINSSNAGSQIVDVTVAVIARLNATVKLNISADNVSVDNDIQLKATVVDIDKNPIYGTRIEFILSNDSLVKLADTKVYTNQQGVAATTLTPLSVGNLTIKAVDPVGSYDEINLTINPKGLIKFDLSLIKGWNLISIPLILENKSVENVFKGINYSGLFYYYEGLRVPSIVYNNLGYWVRADNDTKLKVVGLSPNCSLVNLNKGWNLVGYPSTKEEKLSEIIKSINVTAIFGYNGSWASYAPARSVNSLQVLEPGYGYWFNVLNESTLLIYGNCTACPVNGECIGDLNYTNS